MSRTSLAVQRATRLSPLIQPTMNAVDAVNGNSFDNTTKSVILWVVNGSGGVLTVTIDYPGTYEDNTYQDNVKTIPSGQSRIIGPFPATYNQTDNGDNRVLVDWSTGTSVTVAVIEVIPQT